MTAANGGSDERSVRRAGFEAEALRQLDALHAFGFSLTGEREKAETLVSDTFTRASELWQPYRLGTNIRAWLFAILYELFVGRSGRRSERKAALARAPGEPPDSQPAPASKLDVRDAPVTHDELSGAIDDLPVECRAAVLLRDLHGLTYAEIAQVLGIPERTARSRLLRGRRLLQAALAR